MLKSLNKMTMYNHNKTSRQSSTLIGKIYQFFYSFSVYRLAKTEIRQSVMKPSIMNQTEKYFKYINNAKLF